MLRGPKNKSQTDEEGIRAGKFKQRKYITEIVVDDIGATEGQVENEKDLRKGMHEDSCPCYSHEDSTHPMVHDAVIVQGLANGYIVIIGHNCEQ
jgi:hypothetical protein